jgi:hypothetical protein
MSRIKDPKKIATIVVEMCQLLGFEDARKQFGIVQIWNDVVGSAIAKATTLERFSDGSLFIKVKNPAWRMELNYRKHDIIAKLNGALECSMVKEIIFK